MRVTVRVESYILCNPYLLQMVSVHGFPAVQYEKSRSVVLDATAVEVDEDAEPDEWIPTVQ